MTDARFSLQNQEVIYNKLLTSLKAFEFEEALKINKQYHVSLTLTDMNRVIKDLVKQRESINFSHQFDRRIKALKRFRDYGYDLEKIIEKTILPEGYNGKILIVAIMSSIGKLTCLRSGDLWHREILKNTENEIKDLGFFKSSVYELGGAHVQFETNGDIIIFGTSNDFGSCDKVCALNLIHQLFKNRRIEIID